MSLTITHNYSCYPMENSTNRTRYAYSMALISSRDLVDRDIRDIYCQPLQVLLDHLVVTSIPSCYLDCFPSSLNGRYTWRSVWSYIYIVKEFLISPRIKNIKNISYFKIYKKHYKNKKCASYLSSPIENPQVEPSLGLL
jgi:hypothetical protein